MSTNRILVPDRTDDFTSTNRNHRHRLSQFADWLDNTGRQWDQVDHRVMKEYVEFLELVKSLAPSSILAHLSTIRARYDEIVQESNMPFRSRNQSKSTKFGLFGSQGRKTMSSEEPTWTNPGRDLHKNVGFQSSHLFGHLSLPTVYWELLTDQQIAKQKSSQPEVVEHLRLTVEQANTLLNSPGTDTLQCLRDTAILALMLCTGVRESEIRALDVSDLCQENAEGYPSLHVPQRLGCTERFIPYGDMLWVRDITEEWLDQAEISEGPLLRGLYKGGTTLRPDRIGLRSIGHILSSYPIRIGDQDVNVTSLMLRRTYARQLYDAKIPIGTIQQYLGLSSSDAVLDYIGLKNLRGDGALPPSLYSFTDDS